ncbi:endonuclease/exonuclease/phosphatase family protein [Phanerochaete sordida]|uniref:Endonuclease/exonuclease/phosphatase family protein n=1 Tax=Phanerochaete sordida TaxID=48140 RepID=A0A9P3LBK9_9APHY|nr:endonuclease/exonuclease/phosphatase family protein [Phanerochaete sordida]
MHSRSRSGGSQPQTKPSTYHEVRPRVWSRRKLCWRYISRWRRHKSPPADADSEGTPSPDTAHFSFRPRPASRSRSRSRSRGRGAAPASEGPIPESLQLLTWNIDALGGSTRERVATLLNYIQHHIFECADRGQPAPCCVLLQEVAKDALSAILEHAWVREHFVVAPTKPEHWPGAVPFGNVTLVARTVPVAGAWILEYGCSVMKRHALIVDVRLGTGTAADGERTVRVANVHLESLALGAPYRPWQLRDTVEALARRDIDAGIVAGDMNAVTVQDAALPAWTGLVDAWKGAEDGGENTWGYQPPSREFLPGRLDKVLYLPNGEFEVDVPERVGVGVKTSGGQWASDHFGLLTTIRMLA